MKHQNRYRITWTDQEIVQAIRRYGVEQLEPPNLRAFYENLPRPEKDKLIAVARSEESGIDLS